MDLICGGCPDFCLELVPAYSCVVTTRASGLMTVPLDTVRPDSAAASTALGQDVLSVTAGEPSTHFNLDQLLNIVQSFQLDTTQAVQEPGHQEKKV